MLSASELQSLDREDGFDCERVSLRCEPPPPNAGGTWKGGDRWTGSLALSERVGQWKEQTQGRTAMTCGNSPWNWWVQWRWKKCSRQHRWKGGHWSIYWVPTGVQANTESLPRVEKVAHLQWHRRSHQWVCHVITKLFARRLLTILLLYEQIIRECIANAPETYLDEIQDAIKKKTGTQIGIATIWRFIKRSGFTLKKVCPPPFFWIQTLTSGTLPSLTFILDIKTGFWKERER